MANTRQLARTVGSQSPAELLARTALDLLQDEKAIGKSSYRRFQKTYYDDPVGFALACFNWPDGEALAPYQAEILGAIVEKHRVCVRSLHGAGKSTMCAIAILWYALTRDGTDWKVVTTASAWRQLEKYLWPEVHKWARLLRWDQIGRPPFSEDTELFTLSLRLNTGEAFAVASNKPERIEGAHAKNIFYIFDESKIVPDPIWDSAEGAFSAGTPYWFAVSTPGAPIGRFYDIQSRKQGYDDWWVRHIRLQEAVDAGRVRSDWANARFRQWGPKSARYRNRVLGEFSQDDADVVIQLDWIEAAVERWKSLEDAGQLPASVLRYGIDVARAGSNKSVIAGVFGNVCIALEKIERMNTMELAGNINLLLRTHVNAMANVDIIGVGAGVYDRLVEEFPNRIMAFVASESTDWSPNEEIFFVNKRSAAWWFMREMLDPANGLDIALPDDDELIGDLSTPTYRTTSGGKLLIEPKDQIAKRIGRSTDCADAVIMAFWNAELDYGMQYA